MKRNYQTPTTTKVQLKQECILTGTSNAVGDINSNLTGGDVITIGGASSNPGGNVVRGRRGSVWDEE